jgi:subtilase family serine protease
VEDVTPYDFATIYNVLPLWNASTPIDGRGQTIAIAGTSAIVESDIDTFRSSFGLPAYTSANVPTVVSGNSSPLTVCPDSAGLCTIDDLIENSLDVEWSGAVAKGANIVLVASYPNSSSDDNLYDSESYHRQQPDRQHHECELRSVRAWQRHRRQRAVLQPVADRLYRGHCRVRRRGRWRCVGVR